MWSILLHRAKAEDPWHIPSDCLSKDLQDLRYAGGIQVAGIGSPPLDHTDPRSPSKSENQDPRSF